MVGTSLPADRVHEGGIRPSPLAALCPAFSALTSSSPTSAFNMAIEAVRNSTGYRPNVWVIPQAVINVLGVHGEIGGKASGNFLDKLAGQLQVERQNLLIPFCRHIR
jgi:hypothetical protein